MSFPADDSASESAEQRQPRQSRLVKAALECERFGRFDVTLRNISQTGIGGQGPHSLHHGERLTVHLPGHGPMEGIVRWVAGLRFGIETTGEILADRLRAAHGGGLTASDQSAQFHIVPPPKLVAKRPALLLGISPRR